MKMLWSAKLLMSFSAAVFGLVLFAMPHVVLHVLCRLFPGSPVFAHAQCCCPLATTIWLLATRLVCVGHFSAPLCLWRTSENQGNIPHINHLRIWEPGFSALGKLKCFMGVPYFTLFTDSTTLRFWAMTSDSFSWLQIQRSSIFQV